MSGRGRKRADNGSGSTGTPQQGHPPHQVRQGSSFWSCPACGTSVHTALMQFHISSCPVVGSDEALPLMSTKNQQPRQQRTEERREHDGSAQRRPLGSPEFARASASSGRRGISQRPAWAEEEEEEEELLLQGRLSSSMEAGGLGEQPSCLEPETPIQEGRTWFPAGVPMTASPTPLESLKCGSAEARRKRLFEDWGEMLSPEPELGVQLSPNDAATAPFLPVGDLLVKGPEEFEGDKSRVLVDSHLGRKGGDQADVETAAHGKGKRDVVKVQDRRQERQEEVIVQDSHRSEKLPQELGKNLEQSKEQKLHRETGCSFGTVGQIQNESRDGEGVVSHREVQLENALRELREKYSGALLRETELQRLLKVKDEECEELQRELLSVRGQFQTTVQELKRAVKQGERETAATEISSMFNQSQSTQIFKEDEPVATQLLSQTSNSRTSRSSSPKSYNVIGAGNGKQATQLLSDDLDSGCSPCLPEARENCRASQEFRGGYGTDAATPPDGTHESLVSPKTTLNWEDKYPVRRLFAGGADMTDGSRKELSERLLLSSTRAAAGVLRTQSPGEALKPADEHEKSSGLEGSDNASLQTVGSQGKEDSPGRRGSPITPEEFAVMMGEQEKALITEMLDRFPPAQGRETQTGLDPFDDSFFEAAIRTASNVPTTSKNPIPIVDVRTFESDGAEHEYNHDNERPSEDSQDETLAEMGPKRKRRKAAVVIDSDSDADLGVEDIVHGGRPSTTRTVHLKKEWTLSGGKVDSGNSNHASNPAMETSTKDRSLDQRHPLSPSINVLFGTEEEENAPVISGGGSRKRFGRFSSGSSPDLAIVGLCRDRKVCSPRSVNVILTSSDEEDDICEGSRGIGSKSKRRRLVRVGESPDRANGLQPHPVLEEETKETGTQVVRRSDRLRNVYTSVPKQTTVRSEREEVSDSMEDVRSENYGASGDGSSSKPLVLDDDEEEDRIESESPDSRPIAARRQQRKDKATGSRRSSGVQRDLFGSKLYADGDVEDDIDTDDSFINDDPESDVGVCNASAEEEVSESGEESEIDGSSGTRCPSDELKIYNWELEGDMLADLAKDADLCLRGLCALYHRQQEDEKYLSSSKYRNKIGFSAFHSARASKYASFLMGEGDMSGPVLKTSEEFEEEFDEKALTYCSDMCIHYSKQLFDIYQNSEDPYFPQPYICPLT